MIWSPLLFVFCILLCFWAHGLKLVWYFPYNYAVLVALITYIQHNAWHIRMISSKPVWCAPYMYFVCLSVLGDVRRWKGILFKEPSLPAMSTSLGALLEVGCFRRTLLSWLGKLGYEISEATVFSWARLSWAGCFSGMIFFKSGIFDIQHTGYTGYLPNLSKQFPRWHETYVCQSKRIRR